MQDPLPDGWPSSVQTDSPYIQVQEEVEDADDASSALTAHATTTTVMDD